MPSELEDLQAFSSTLSFNHSSSLPSESQLGIWSSETTVNSKVEGSFASSYLKKPLPVGSQMVKPLECPDHYPNQDRKVTCSLLQTDKSETADSHSLTLLRPVDRDPIRSTSYFAEGQKNSMLGAHYENSLFSSSLSELFCRKLRLSANNALYDHPPNPVASKSEQEEPFESLEEIEAQTIGNLLPNDDDLLSGMTEGLAYIAQPRNVNDMEDSDIFSSVGGMDLDDDSSSAKNTNANPGRLTKNQLGMYHNTVAGRHPSRTLLVRNIDVSVGDFELRALFEQCGDLRSLYAASRQHGFVLISYYDLRAAQNAIKALQNWPLGHKKLDIHYSIPEDNRAAHDINQGTLIVYNLDSSVSNDELHQIFCIFGEIKEIWASPHRSDKKMIEFYDVRAAEAALQALDKSDIAGKTIKLEPSRSEGRRPFVQQVTSELEQGELGIILQQNNSPCNSTTGFSVPFSQFMSTSSGIENEVNLGRNHAPRALANSLMGSGSSTPNGLQSLLGVDPMGNQSGLAQHVRPQGKNIDIHGMSTFHPHSLPEFHDGLTSYNSPGTIAANYHHVRDRVNTRQLHRISSNGQSAELNKNVLGSANGGHPITGNHFTWSNSYQQQPTGMMWPNSPSASFVNGISSPHAPPQLHGLPRAPSQMPNRVLPLNNHHVGSAPTVNHMWDRCHAYMGDAEASGFHPGSLESIGVSNNSLHSVEFVSRNLFPRLGGNCLDLSIHNRAGVQSPQQRSMMFPGRGHMTPMVNMFDLSSERGRSRRTENSNTQADRKQFELDIDRIMKGEDNRTTLMLKNIPNKYTSKMLLAAIDEGHKGTYDFIYLPIDFKNKCNVGYAFINMTDPKHIVPFYQTFNGKKWEKFNSEKVATLAYARIQGKAALIAHFQNSSLMNEDKRCRPILFNTEGPNAGDQVPFPMGVNVRTRPGRSRTNNSQEETHQGSPPSTTNVETNGNISVSAKESD